MTYSVWLTIGGLVVVAGAVLLVYGVALVRMRGDLRAQRDRVECLEQRGRAPAVTTSARMVPMSTDAVESLAQAVAAEIEKGSARRFAGGQGRGPDD